MTPPEYKLPGWDVRDFLETLQRLPPGVELVGSATSELRRLVEEIRSLPPATDAFAHLAAAQPYRCARLALQDELDRFESVVAGLAAQKRGLIRPASGTGPTKSAGSGDEDPELAGAVAAALRTDNAQATAHSAGLALLADVLSAGESDSPIAWVSRHRTAMAVDRALSSVANQVRAGNQDALLPLLIMRPDAPDPLEVDDAFRVRVLEMIIGASGISISSEAIMPSIAQEQTSSRSMPSVLRSLTWPGFALLEDDLGYRYFPTYVEAGPTREYIGGSLSSCSAYQRFIPAPAPAAARLLLTAPGYELTETDRGTDPTARPTLQTRTLGPAVRIALSLGSA